MLQKWKHHAVTTTTTSALRLPAVLQASRAYKKDAACATPLCPCAILDSISIACDSGENKEVKGNKKPVKMYVEMRF